jgi:2-dehydropantoate 2-reductase
MMAASVDTIAELAVGNPCSANHENQGEFMKVCVFGVGAVGGTVATRLLAAGADEISLIARGAQLNAIREHGLTLRSGDKEIKAKAEVATDDPSTLPPQDLVLVTLKAYGVPGAAAAIARLLAPQGCAVFLLNGIPWWWRHGLPGNSGTLPLLDPEGALWNQVKPERALGCVVLCPCDIVAPGVIVNTGPLQLVVGEPDGSSSTRIEAAAAMLRRGGIDTKVSGDLRRDIWNKLVSNASGNSLTALTRLDLGSLGSDPGLCALSVSLMQEVLAVAAALGWDLRAKINVDNVARRGKPGQRTSALQDVLRGRPLEVEAHLGQIQAFAREAGVAVPIIDIILPLLRGLDGWLRKA